MRSIWTQACSHHRFRDFCLWHSRHVCSFEIEHFIMQIARSYFRGISLSMPMLMVGRFFTGIGGSGLVDVISILLNGQCHFRFLSKSQDGY